MATLPLGGRFYQSDSLPVSAQECINLRLNTVQTEGTTDKYLLPTPGIRLADTAGTDVYNRDGHVFQEVPYFVNGDELYRTDRTLDAFGVATYSNVLVGSGITGTERVMMADNGAEGGQICIIVPERDDQFNAYIYTELGGLVQISDGDFDGPVSNVRFVDGYFLFVKKDSQKFFNSALRDGLSYNALDFGTAEADPDPIVGLFILHNEPVLMGTETAEPFQNVGGSGFPFQRIEGAIQRKGLASKFAIEEVNDIMIFLGGSVNETPCIWMSDGGRPVKVSSIALDNEIATYPIEVTSNCFSWKYSFGGSQFVAFHFPTKRTFIFDFTAKEWHTRTSIDGDGQIAESRISTVLQAYGVLLVGDRYTTNIGILDEKEYYEYGEIIRRKFITPQLDNEGQPFNVDALELVCEAGVGLNSGYGENPQVLMSFSKDGGKKYSYPVPRTPGRIGENEHRTIWNTLGRFARQVCFMFEMEAPVKWRFQKIEAQIE